MPYPSGHHDPRTSATVMLLEDWFWALENGTAEQRLPDPSYERANGQPSWNDDELDQIVEALDREFNKELSWASLPSGSIHADAGPGFCRLQPLQRLALAQGIDRVFREHPKRLPVAPTHEELTQADLDYYYGDG